VNGISSACIRVFSRRHGPHHEVLKTVMVALWVTEAPFLGKPFATSTSSAGEVFHPGESGRLPGAELSYPFVRMAQ
jgi:hypothetical protein